MGVGDAVVAALEQAVAEDAARADGDLAPLLLINDVLPDRLAGCPARLIVGVDDREDAVPLVALADLVAEEGEGHGHRRREGGKRPDDILPAQTGGKQHTAADDAVDDGRAVIALNVDDGDGHKEMEQQLAQLLRLVEPAADVVQVHGEGEDEADLRQLGGLEGEAAQLIPRVVVGVACIVADGQRADAHVADDQRGQHEAPCEGHMDGPDVDEAAVVDVGQEDGHRDADGGCACLHHGPAVVADAGDLAGQPIHGEAVSLLCGPRRQRQHSHRAAEQAEQEIGLVRPLPISLNAFQKSTTFLVSQKPRLTAGRNIPLPYYTAGREGAQDGRL